MHHLRVGHIELFVRDSGAARRFYEHVLGFAVTAVQGERGEFVWLSLGNQEFLLRPGTPEGADSYRMAGAGLVLYTDDLPGTAARLVERGLVFRGEDGPGCLTFTDPDDHWFQLVDPDATH